MSQPCQTRLCILTLVVPPFRVLCPFVSGGPVLPKYLLISEQPCDNWQCSTWVVFVMLVSMGTPISLFTVYDYWQTSSCSFLALSLSFHKTTNIISFHLFDCLFAFLSFIIFCSSCLDLHKYLLTSILSIFSHHTFPSDYRVPRSSHSTTFPPLKLWWSSCPELSPAPSPPDKSLPSL